MIGSSFKRYISSDGRKKLGLVEVEVEGKGEESGVAIGNEGAAPKKEGEEKSTYEFREEIRSERMVVSR